MTDFPFISIIVVNYNLKRYLKECFVSLAEINYPRNKHEIIMVYNASKDSSVEYVLKIYHFVKILKINEKL